MRLNHCHGLGHEYLAVDYQNMLRNFRLRAQS